MDELRILFIQESRDYCTAIEQMLASGGAVVHSEYITDSAFLDTVSANSWNVIVGENSLLRAGSPDIDTLLGTLGGAAGHAPLIVITNHRSGTARFLAFGGFQEITRNDTAEDVAETIRTMTGYEMPPAQSPQTSDMPPRESALEAPAAHRSNDLKTANRLLLAEIHERRKAEIALKRSEELLRRSHEELETRVAERTADLARSERESRELYGLLDKMFSTTEMLIAYLDTDLRYVHVNKAFANVIGKEPAFFPGKHYLDLCPVAEHEAVLKKVLSSGRAYSAYEQIFDFPAIDSKHTLYWDWYVQPSTDESGRVDGIIMGMINVTDRVHSEAALRQNEQRLVDAQRMAHMGSWVYDADHDSLECSDEFCRIFGIRKQKRIKLDAVLKRIHPDDRDKLQDMVRDAVSRRESRSSEHRIVLPNGEERFVEFHFEITADGDHVRFIRGISRDITSLRSAEQSRRESEERLRGFIDSATESFMLFDTELNLIEINDHAANLLGGDRDDLLGKHLTDLMPDARKSGQHSLYRSVLDTGEPVSFDHIVGDMKGSRYFNQQAFVVGENLGIILTEITERKQYENTLLQKQRRLETMLKNETLLSRIASRFNSPEPFDEVVMELLHTLTGKLEVGFAAAWSLAGNEVIAEIRSDDGNQIFNRELIGNLHALMSLKKDERMVISDIRKLPRDEQRYFNSSALRSIALLPASIGNHTVAYICFGDAKRHAWQSEDAYLLSTAADIFASAWERQLQTKARIEAEHQRTEALQVAERVSRMASIGEIAGGITHEINQPLTAIKVSADSIRFWNRNNNNVLPEKFVTMIEKISLSVDRISEIIRHMRAFWVSPGHVDHTAVDLNNVVDRALSLLNRQLHTHRIKPVIEKSGGKILITGNPIHIEQILINLMMNAMNALDKVDRGEKFVNIVTSRVNGMAVLSVSDNGIGLPPDAGDKIYDPFFSTRKPGEGTGLGLAITKRFVDAHHGDICAELNDPHGAVFTVRFPLRKTKEEQHEHTSC